MERPERPSRPEKGMRNGGHPYRERHRIASSDSESENADTQPLYPFMLKQDDGSHRSSGLFYRKRPGPQHFVSPLAGNALLSDVLERRSNNRNCTTRIRLVSPHATASSSNWDASKRFCPGLSSDQLANGPEQKLPQRMVSTTILSTCLMDSHSSAAAAAASATDRPDRDDSRVRSHTNNCSWPTGAGATDPTGPSSLLQFFEEDENNTLRNMTNEELDIGSSELAENNTRNTHGGIGFRNNSGHSSNVQNENNNEHPTRTSSHILRALDELRFNHTGVQLVNWGNNRSVEENQGLYQNNHRDPWLTNMVVERGLDTPIPMIPGLELPQCRSNNGNVFNATSSQETPLPMFRRRVDFNVVDSDNDHDEDSEELIERVTGGPREPVPVEEVSDLDDYDTIIEEFRDIRSRQAVLTHPSDGNISANNNDEHNNASNPSDVNFIENNDNNRLLPSSLPNNEHNSSHDTIQTECSNSDNDRGSTLNAGGNGDDVIILTMSPSPRRLQQQQDVRAATPQPSASHQMTGSGDSAVEALPTVASPNMAQATPQSNPVNSSHSTAINEIGDKGNRLDCEEFNSKLVSLLECPVCMETIVPPIQQCRKGHPVCQVCRPKLTVCPTCRARFSENRNLLMEKVAEMMQFPCKNVHMGCPTKVQLKDKRKHELSCGFRQYDCIEETCNWKGFKQELVVHTSLIHTRQVIVGNNQKIKVPLHHNAHTTWVLSAMDEVFIVMFVNRDHFLYGCTIYLGNYENAKNYIYEFSVCNKDGMYHLWRGKTFPDKGQAISSGPTICNKGFSLSLKHSIIEERHPRHANKVEVTVKVFKNDSSSFTPLSSTSSSLNSLNS